MYIPAQFLQQDVDVALKLIAAEPFGMLISTVEGMPVVSHIPFVIAESEPELVLVAHLAKANPHWRTLDGVRATAVFRGPHGYISPSYYTDPKHNVPTWNYEVVHCSGKVNIAPESEKITILKRLVDAMEDGLPAPWNLDAMDVAYRDGLMGAIVAFTLRVDQLQAKFKLGQNRDAADRAGAVAGLRATGRNGNAALANEMENCPSDA